MHRSFDFRRYRLDGCYTKNNWVQSILYNLLYSGLTTGSVVTAWWIGGGWQQTDRHFSCKLLTVKVLCIVYFVSSHKFIREPTYPTLRSDLLYADRSNILLNSIYQKTENSTSQAVALLYLKIDSSIIHVVYYLSLDAAGSSGLI
jgi:hypothetical protein